MIKGVLFPRVGLRRNVKENLGNLEGTLSGTSENRM